MQEKHIVNDDEAPHEKKVKHNDIHEQIVSKLAMLPSEIMIEIFTFIPYIQLIRNILFQWMNMMLMEVKIY
jgi:hypothetical protein